MGENCSIEFESIGWRKWWLNEALPVLKAVVDAVGAVVLPLVKGIKLKKKSPTNDGSVEVDDHMLSRWSKSIAWCCVGGCDTGIDGGGIIEPPFPNEADEEAVDCGDDKEVDEGEEIECGEANDIGFGVSRYSMFGFFISTRSNNNKKSLWEKRGWNKIEGKLVGFFVGTSSESHHGQCDYRESTWDDQLADNGLNGRSPWSLSTRLKFGARARTYS